MWHMADLAPLREAPLAAAAAAAIAAAGSRLTPLGMLCNAVEVGVAPLAPRVGGCGIPATGERL